MKHLKIFVDRIHDLSEHDIEPYLRLRLGDELAETPVGTFSHRGEFEIISTVAFHNIQHDEPLAIEVVDAATDKAIGWSQMSDWKSLIVEGKARKGRVHLKPSGVVSMEFRYFDKDDSIPNRIDLVVHAVDNLPSWVNKPFVFLNIDRTTVTTGPAHSGGRDAQGHFEWDEKQTLPYQGERALVIQVSDEDDQPVGRARFDLWEVLNAHKTGQKKAGQLALTDPAGYQTGTISVAIAMWDSEDEKAKSKDTLELMEDLERRRQDDISLLAQCRETGEAAIEPTALKCDSHLTQAGDDISAARTAADGFSSPNAAKHNFQQMKRDMKKHLRDAELELEAAEKLLQMMVLSTALAEQERGSKVRGKIATCVRDANNSKGGKNDEDVARMQAIQSEADQDMDVIGDSVQTIRHSSNGPDMLRSLDRAVKAREHLEQLLSEALQRVDDINLRNKHDREIIRREENLAYKTMTLPIAHKPGMRQKPVCWGCCLCCGCL